MKEADILGVVEGEGKVKVRERGETALAGAVRPGRPGHIHDEDCCDDLTVRPFRIKRAADRRTDRRRSSFRAALSRPRRRSGPRGGAGAGRRPFSGRWHRPGFVPY